MKKTLIVTFLMIFGLISLNSQMVREWKTVATGHFNDTYFVKESAVCDGKYIVALSRANVYPSYNMFDSNYVLLSQDSGKSWNGILKWGYEKFDSSMKNWDDLNFNYVDMPSKDLILIIGHHYVPGNWSDEISFMCITTDIGKTWNLIRTIPESLNPRFEAVSMLDNKFGLMLVTKDSTEESPYKKILIKTDDCWKTWSEMPIDPSVHTIHKCFSKDNWILATSSNLVVTTDGGKNWNYYEKPKWTYGISFFNDKHWVAVAIMKIQDYPEVRTCSVYKTKNAGVNWELVSSFKSTPYPSYAESDFYDEKNGIIGKYDVLIRTTDGGLTWTNEVLPPESHGNPFNNVKFFSKERAIGVTLKCIYLYTGRIVLQPPSVHYSKKYGEMWDYQFYWNKIIGGEKFKVQIAESRPHWSGGRFYSIPDFEQKLIVDTTDYMDTVINLKTKFFMDYYIRVKAYNDSIESDWSHFESFTTAKDTGHYPQLKVCWPLYPSYGLLLQRSNNTFIWRGVPNAENYSLFIATELNFEIGGLNYVIYDIIDTTYFLSSTLQSKTTYIWWVIAHAKGWADSEQMTNRFVTDTRLNVSDDYLHDHLSLVPNPATDYIEIKLSESSELSESYKIEIYNILGECVKDFTPTLPKGEGERVKIDVSGLHNGIYFLKAGDNIYKFVKM